MTRALSLTILALTLSASAQQPTAPDQLTTTEQIAIAAVSERQQRNQQEAQQINGAVTALLADISRAHPGFHLQDGKLVPNPPAPVAPAKK